MPDDGPDQRLSAYLDGELNAAERALIEARLSSDEGCRRQLESLRAVRAAVAALPKASLPANFAADVLARLPSTPAPSESTPPLALVSEAGDAARTTAPPVGAATPERRRSRAARLWFWPMAALAASVLLALFNPEPPAEPKLAQRELAERTASTPQPPSVMKSDESGPDAAAPRRPEIAAGRSVAPRFADENRRDALEIVGDASPAEPDADQRTLRSFAVERSIAAGPSAGDDLTDADGVRAAVPLLVVVDYAVQPEAMAAGAFYKALERNSIALEDQPSERADQPLAEQLAEGASPLSSLGIAVEDAAAGVEVRTRPDRESGGARGETEHLADQQRGSRADRPVAERPSVPAQQPADAPRGGEPASNAPTATALAGPDFDASGEPDAAARQHDFLFFEGATASERADLAALADAEPAELVLVEAPLEQVQATIRELQAGSDDFTAIQFVVEGAGSAEQAATLIDQLAAQASPAGGVQSGALFDLEAVPPAPSAALESVEADRPAAAGALRLDGRVEEALSRTAKSAAAPSSEGSRTAKELADEVRLKLPLEATETEPLEPKATNRPAPPSETKLKALDAERAEGAASDESAPDAAGTKTRVQRGKRPALAPRPGESPVDRATLDDIAEAETPDRLEAAATSAGKPSAAAPAAPAAAKLEAVTLESATLEHAKLKSAQAAQGAAPGVDSFAAEPAENFAMQSQRRSAYARRLDQRGLSQNAQGGAPNASDYGTTSDAKGRPSSYDAVSGGQRRSGGEVQRRSGQLGEPAANFAERGESPVDGPQSGAQNAGGRYANYRYQLPQLGKSIDAGNGRARSSETREKAVSASGGPTDKEKQQAAPSANLRLNRAMLGQTSDGNRATLGQTSDGGATLSPGPQSAQQQVRVLFRLHANVPLARGASAGAIEAAEATAETQPAAKAASPTASPAKPAEPPPTAEPRPDERPPR